MVKVQRLFAKTNLKFQFAALVPSRVWGRHAPNKKPSQRGKNGDCGRFLGPLRGPSQRGAELGRRTATERIAVPLRIVSADPAPPSSSMKRARVHSDQSLPCQNSFLSRRKKPSIAALSGLQPLADWIGYTDVDSSGRGARDGRAVYAFLREGRGRDCLGTAPVNSVYVFDDRVVLNINFTDDAKTVTREEVFGSSAVDNVPTCWDRTH